ncbi:MAG: glycosyltransferase [Chitinivibrionales bacterium]|nr:glycosyltransferase [Chitinivibrionales bacterium]
MSSVGIVIPVCNCLEYTRRCIRSIRAHCREVGPQVVIVDNGSNDGTGEFLLAQAREATIITNSVNRGFAAACNQGARAVSADIVVFLNNDTQVLAGWLEKLIEASASTVDIGAAGSKLLYPDRRVQHAGIAMFYDKTPYHIYAGCPEEALCVTRQRTFAALTAASLLVPRELFCTAGGFDEEYVNGLEDVDLCLRLRALGRRLMYAPQSVAVHYESQTPGRGIHAQKNERLFHARWDRHIAQDDLMYLLEDDMEVLFYPGSAAPAFVPRGQARAEIGPNLQVAEALERSGRLHKAMNALAQLCRIAPYSADILHQCESVARSVGNRQLAAACRQRLATLARYAARSRSGNCELTAKEST